MKLFVDTADLADIETIAGWGVLSGVTTNPTLLGKVEGAADEIYRRVCELVDGPVSAEVVADSRGDMVKEGRRLAAIHPHIVVKLPMGAEGLAATSALAADDIRVNMTLCFTAPQALLASAAGASFVSPFVGRFDDIGEDGLEHLREIVEALEPSLYDTEVLAASIRTPVHVMEAARMGADIATIPPKVFYQMLQHPLTAKGITTFTEDAEARKARDGGGKARSKAKAKA
jgi:transaldolase